MRVLVGTHVWPACSSVINDIRLSGGIGRVIKCASELFRAELLSRKEPAVLTDVRL